MGESISGFAGILGFAAWIALLLDAIGSRRFRTREFFLVCASPILLAIILNWPLIGTGFHRVLSMAANARIRLLLCFATSVMAAAAIDRLRRTLAIGIAVAAAALLALAMFYDFPSAAARQASLIEMIPSIAVVVAAALSIAMQKRRDIVLLVVVVAVTVEVWSATRDWNPVVPADKVYPPTPLIAKLQALKAAEPRNAPSRMVGIGSMLFTNVPAIFGFEDIRTHDPMANGRYLGALRVLAGYDAEAYFSQWRNLDSRLLDFLNVRYILAEPRLEMSDTQRFKLLYDGKDGRIFENRDVLPRFFIVPAIALDFGKDSWIRTLRAQKEWSRSAVLHALWVKDDAMRRDLLAARPRGSAEASMRIVEASPTRYRLHVSAPRWTLVVSSIPYWPGWHVRKDGYGSLHLEEVNAAFLGFTVPPGESDITVSYFPASFYGGLAVSLITLAALFGFPLWRRRAAR